MTGIQENDHTPDREEHDDCHGSSDTMDLPISEKTVIAFPHEHHWALTQEFLAVFGGPSNVTLIDMAPGSGAKLLGVLLSNGRGIGVARSAFHSKWITDNLIQWVRQKRIVPISQLPKPDSLIQYEKQNKPTPSPVPKAAGTPTPPKAATPIADSAASAPAKSPAATQPIGATAGVKPTGLLEAFGKVASA